MTDNDFRKILAVLEALPPGERIDDQEMMQRAAGDTDGVYFDAQDAEVIEQRVRALDTVFVLNAPKEDAGRHVYYFVEKKRRGPFDGTLSLNPLGSNAIDAARDGGVDDLDR